MQPALDGSELEPERPGRLFAGKSLEVSQNDDFAIRRGQARDRRLDRAYELEPLLCDLRVRDFRRQSLELDASAELNAPALERSQHAPARVLHDRKQPRERAAIPHHVGPARELDERFLHGVVGVEGVATHALPETINAVVILRDEPGERLIVRRRCAHQLRV